MVLVAVDKGLNSTGIFCSSIRANRWSCCSPNLLPVHFQSPQNVISLTIDTIDEATGLNSTGNVDGSSPNLF